jgi:hypothetical protein
MAKYKPGPHLDFFLQFRRIHVYMPAQLAPVAQPAQGRDPFLEKCLQRRPAARFDQQLLLLQVGAAEKAHGPDRRG